MAKLKLDTLRIREAKAPDSVIYLDELRQDYTDMHICQALFEASDLVTSVMLSVFIGGTKSSEVLAACVKDGPTISIRKRAITRVGKHFCNPKKWESTWTALGGTQGLVDHFATASVMDVKLLISAIGSCARRQKKLHTRERAIEELLKALLPRQYPESNIQSQDKRPIQHFCAKLVPACSAEFINSLLNTRDESNLLYLHLPVYRVVNFHKALIHQRIQASVSGKGIDNRIISSHVGDLLRGNADFAMKVLRTRLETIANDDNETWPYGVDEVSILLSHVRALIVKNPSRREPEIKSRLELGLQLIKAKPNPRRSQVHSQIYDILLDCWWRQPDDYEEMLISALRSGDWITREIVARKFLGASRAHKGPQRNGALLRLFCLHTPGLRVDLDTTTDYTSLAKQIWSSKIFFMIERDQAVRLLSGLYDINSEYGFLDYDPRLGRSILSVERIKAIDQENFNVDLLLALLQRDNAGCQQRTMIAVDRLRQKAATAREQTDRAELAKAASALAIASGNLDLYGETVTWQTRFVRDPVTVKVVYSEGIIETKEGVDLLCGMAYESPQEVVLDEVATKIEKANNILRTFQEAKLLAKREPSFHSPDWDSVGSLVESVYHKRLYWAGKLQKQLYSNQVDIFTQIWTSSLPLLDMQESLQHNFFGMSTLFTNLPPESLATCTKLMLESDIQSREKNHNSKFDSLEMLAFKGLQRLVMGDKPHLAMSLVLRTVLERPDASSWHRKFLSVGFMKRLSAKQAHKMLLEFATKIGEKLEEQAYVKVGEAEPSRTAPPRSIIKVTTVKYLAQLLDNAEFISADAAIEVLIELFKNGTHRDVRLATLDSLLSSLNTICNGPEEVWRLNPMVEKIMSALETIIPVVASINESRPPTEEAWQEFTETGSLPGISDISGGLPPLLKAILEVNNQFMYPNIQKLKPEFFKRLLLPIIVQSQAKHQRWVSQFLSKYQANIEPTHVPPTPITPLVWDTMMLKYANILPSRIFEDFNRYILTTLAQPSDMEKFNKRLKTDSSLRNLPEVKHWLHIFSKRRHTYFETGLHKLLQILDHLPPNDASFHRVIDMIVDVVSLILEDYENHMEIWEAFVDELQPHLPSRTYSQLRYTSWQESKGRVIKKVIELLLDKKLKNAEKKPVRLLPSAIKLQLYLLPYSLTSNDTTHARAQWKPLTAQLEDILASSLQGQANLLRWNKVAVDTLVITNIVIQDEQRVLLALHVGQLSLPNVRDGNDIQLNSAINLVKLTLAMELIGTGSNFKQLSKGVKTQFGGPLKQMVKGWQSFGNESILEKVIEWRKKDNELWEYIMNPTDD